MSSGSWLTENILGNLYGPYVIMFGRCMSSREKDSISRSVPMLPFWSPCYYLHLVNSCNSCSLHHDILLACSQLKLLRVMTCKLVTSAGTSAYMITKGDYSKGHVHVCCIATQNNKHRKTCPTQKQQGHPMINLSYSLWPWRHFGHI